MLQIRTWRDLEFALKKNNGILTKEAERFLLGLRKEQRALDILVEYNQGLVKSIAKQNQNRGVEMEDLVHHGTIGLIEAINRFDLASSNKLSTYAWHYITNAIKSSVENESRTIRVPAHQYEAQSKIIRWESSAKNKSDLASLSGLSEKQIDNAKKAFAQIIPEDTAVGIMDESNWESVVEHKLICEEALSILESISVLHRAVIEMSFGLISQPCTVNAMAKELLLSPEEIMTIHNEAIHLLRLHFGEEEETCYKEHRNSRMNPN